MSDILERLQAPLSRVRARGGRGGYASRRSRRQELMILCARIGYNP